MARESNAKCVFPKRTPDERVRRRREINDRNGILHRIWAASVCNTARTLHIPIHFGDRPNNTNKNKNVKRKYDKLFFDYFRENLCSLINIIIIRYKNIHTPANSSTVQPTKRYVALCAVSRLVSMATCMRSTPLSIRSIFFSVIFRVTHSAQYGHTDSNHRPTHLPLHCIRRITEWEYASACTTRSTE